MTTTLTTPDTGTPLTTDDLQALLAREGIHPTVQRLEIARLLFRECHHFSADEVYERINRERFRVSKATVYNTLGLFARAGLVREVIADPARVFYDSNTVPHHHFFDVSTGELSDIDEATLKVSGLPSLPPGKELAGVDVVVRVRSAAGAG